MGDPVGLVRLPRRGWCFPGSSGGMGLAAVRLLHLPSSQTMQEPPQNQALMGGGGAHEIQRVCTRKCCYVCLQSGAAEFLQQLHSLHASRVCWVYSLLQQDFNPFGSQETQGKSPEQIDWSKQKPPTFPKTLSNFQVQVWVTSHFSSASLQASPLATLLISRHCGQLQSDGGFSIQLLSPFPDFSRLQAKGGQAPLPQGSGS